MDPIMRKPSVLILIGILVFFAFNILADKYLRGVHADLTEDKLYTLSAGSKKVMHGLENQVKFEFYFSRNLAVSYPNLLSYGKRIETMLRTLVDQNPTKAVVSILNPKPFSELEDSAVEYGLRGIPLPNGDNLYMGLRISNELNGEKIIPFLSEDREKFLEYDLMHALTTMQNVGKPTIGLLTTLPLAVGPGGARALLQGTGAPYTIYKQLQENYTLEPITDDFTRFPKGMNVLLMVNPPKVGEPQLALIEDYIARGGKTLVFTDPYSEMLAAADAANKKDGVHMNELLSKFGVQMQPNKVVGDRKLAQKVSMGQIAPDSVKSYPLWLNVTKDYLNKSDIIAGNLENLSLASAGSLVFLDNSMTEMTPVITTSDQAMLFDVSDIMGMPDPDKISKDLYADNVNHIIAARITGEARAGNQLNLFVMADSDLFDDRFWVQIQDMMGQKITVPSAGNGSFILGLLDQMSGNDALVNLRARGISQRPFDRVISLRLAAEKEHQQQEEQLEKRLKDVEMRLDDVAKENAGGVVLSASQQQEIDKIKAELVSTRQSLRKVKRGLRQEIETLEGRLIFINTIFIPILVVIIGGFVLLRRRRKAARHHY